MLCSWCGANNADGLKFCKVCGAAILDENESCDKLLNMDTDGIYTTETAKGRPTAPVKKGKGIRLTGSASVRPDTYEKKTEIPPEVENAAPAKKGKGIKLAGASRPRTETTCSEDKGSRPYTGTSGIRLSGTGEYRAGAAGYTEAPALYCTVCGSHLIDGVCPKCASEERLIYSGLEREPTPGSDTEYRGGRDRPSNRSLLIAVIASATVVIAALALILFRTLLFGGVKESAAGDTYLAEGAQSTGVSTALSGQCDSILCSGTDIYGDTYELVANQSESAQDYEITVGIIKNGQWLVPMTADFPFLGENGLFHVANEDNFVITDLNFSEEEGASLNYEIMIRENIYFVDVGAFMMKERICSNDIWSNDQINYIFYNCRTGASEKLDKNKYSSNLLTAKAEHEQGALLHFGYIQTDGGKFIMYRLTEGSKNGWLEDQAFEWSLFDVSTLQISVIGRDIKSNYPCAPISEGLVFARDKCFYDTQMREVIDLSDYNIDPAWDDDLYFENGSCTFETENSLGTAFITTIDRTGRVLSEVQKNSVS